LANEGREKDLPQFAAKRALVSRGNGANDLLLDCAGTFMGAVGQTSPESPANGNEVEAWVPGVPVIFARDKQSLRDQRWSKLRVAGETSALKLDSCADHVPVGRC